MNLSWFEAIQDPRTIDGANTVMRQWKKGKAGLPHLLTILHKPDQIASANGLKNNHTMIPYFPTSIRPDYTMGAINAFRVAHSASATKDAKYAKLILGQMSPIDAHNFIRHYVHGESFEAIFGNAVAEFAEGRQLFQWTLKTLIAAVYVAGHPFPSLRWPLKQIYCKHIDQYFPEVVKGRYVRLPDIPKQAAEILGVSETASGEELLDALLKKLMANNSDNVPRKSRRATRMDEQRRCCYCAWKMLRGDDAIYAVSHSIEDFGLVNRIAPAGICW